MVETAFPVCQYARMLILGTADDGELQVLAVFSLSRQLLMVYLCPYFPNLHY